MKNMILAAFAALTLSVAIAPLAQAATLNVAQTYAHGATYSNNGGNSGGQFVGGGD
jgi:hypothetical protein